VSNCTIHVQEEDCRAPHKEKSAMILITRFSVVVMLLVAFATPEVVADEVCQVTSPDGTLRSVSCCTVFEDSCIYKGAVIIGTSPESWEEAANNAIATAETSNNRNPISDTVKIIELGATIGEDGKIKTYRARVNVSFKYEK
jgi:flavin-binding protein dodecin